MGTRAAFWVGDPTDLENREWLGCVAWDGYEWLDTWKGGDIKTVDLFRKAVSEIILVRKDFSYPGGGRPFPWDDDVFLTDITYAFFDGGVKVCWFHLPFQAIQNVEELEMADPTHINVPAPEKYNPGQPDSILIVRV